jgi:hypothetical protein
MSDTEHCLSFLTICAILDFNGEAIRRKLRLHFAPGRASQLGLPHSLRQLYASPLGQSPRTEQRVEPDSYGEVGA